MTSEEIKLPVGLDPKLWRPFKSPTGGRPSFRFHRSGGGIRLGENGKWRWRIEEAGPPIGEEDLPGRAAARVEEAFRFRDEYEAGNEEFRKRFAASR